MYVNTTVRRLSFCKMQNCSCSIWAGFCLPSPFSYFVWRIMLTPFYNCKTSLLLPQKSIKHKKILHTFHLSWVLPPLPLLILCVKNNVFTLLQLWDLSPKNQKYIAPVPSEPVFASPPPRPRSTTAEAAEVSWPHIPKTLQRLQLLSLNLLHIIPPK